MAGIRAAGEAWGMGFAGAAAWVLVGILLAGSGSASGAVINYDESTDGDLSMADPLHDFGALEHGANSISGHAFAHRDNSVWTSDSDGLTFTIAAADIATVTQMQILTPYGATTSASYWWALTGPSSANELQLLVQTGVGLTNPSVDIGPGTYRLAYQSAHILGYPANAYGVDDDWSFSISVAEAPIPEPASVALLGIASLAGMGLLGRRKRGVGIGGRGWREDARRALAGSGMRPLSAMAILLTLSGYAVAAPSIRHTGQVAVDEDNLGPLVAIGSVDVDWGSGGSGSFVTNGNFTATIPLLSSDGQSISVTEDGTTYVGTLPGDVEIFHLELGAGADGSFVFYFLQWDALDHNTTGGLLDSIDLQFGVTAIDGLGGSADTIVTARVFDGADIDAPIPEPGSVALLGFAGLAALGLRGRRR